jgi:outer membrane protein insertion porin family
VAEDDGHGGTTTTLVCTADYSIGGNAKFEGRTELFFSNPFEEEPSKNFRLSAFIDFARVYTNVYNAAIVEDDRLRASYGLGAVWITPVGALNFNLAWPLISYEGDETEIFGFNIGAPF